MKQFSMLSLAWAVALAVARATGASGCYHWRGSEQFFPKPMETKPIIFTAR